MFHVKHRRPRVLLINPWITDFAAYNLWVRPHGLLSVASLLRRYGFSVALIDCLEHVVVKRKYGDGKFERIEIETPPAVRGFLRKYCQYGIPEDLFRQRLGAMERPDLVAVASGMTYWYPGVFKAIRIARQFFHDTPILLGGIYATLCYEHASKYSGADRVFQGRSITELLNIISELTDMDLHASDPPPHMDAVLYPAFDLYPHLDYISMITSIGCPFHCSYCASPVLSSGQFERRDPVAVVQEVEYWVDRFGVENIAFYDDALLANPRDHILVILNELKKRQFKCNFHVPNGLHIREIDEELANLLYQCRFKTVRLGLETSQEAVQVDTGGKVDNRSFEEAVLNLRRAGYSQHEIGVYVMVGLPRQKADEVEETIAYVKRVGALPKLVEYSPIPHTPLFEKAKEVSRFDLEKEPLFHNNSLLPCQWEGLGLQDLQRLKVMARS